MSLSILKEAAPGVALKFLDKSASSTPGSDKRIRLESQHNHQAAVLQVSKPDFDSTIGRFALCERVDSRLALRALKAIPKRN